VFTARYTLSPNIKQIRFVFKGLIYNHLSETQNFEPNSSQLQTPSDKKNFTCTHTNLHNFWFIIFVCFSPKWKIFTFCCLTFLTNSMFFPPTVVFLHLLFLLCNLFKNDGSQFYIHKHNCPRTYELKFLFTYIYNSIMNTKIGVAGVW
jgi:hypothetical protein